MIFFSSFKDKCVLSSRFCSAVSFCKLSCSSTPNFREAATVTVRFDKASNSSMTYTRVLDLVGTKLHCLLHDPVGFVHGMVPFLHLMLQKRNILKSTLSTSTQSSCRFTLLASLSLCDIRFRDNASCSMSCQAETSSRRCL